MLKKTIQFTDEFGNAAEFDAYFNLTKAECIELNIRNDLEVVGRSRDNNQIMDTFKRLLSLAYGERTGDNKFLKTMPSGQPYFAAFSTTEAYSELFMEIWTNPDYALEFIKSIMPAEVVAEADLGVANSQSSVPGHMAQHPSMQGHQKPQSGRRVAEEQPKQRELHVGDNGPYVQTPAIATDPEYQEFLEQKRQREAALTRDERVERPAQIRDETPGHVPDHLT